MIRIQLSIDILRRGFAVAVLTLLVLGGVAHPALADPGFVAATPNLPLTWVGERIDYHVAFGVVPAGKASLTVENVDTIDGQEVLHVVSLARSAKAFDVVFRVRDRVESWFDADSVYSLRFRKLLREGRYRDEKRVEFDIERARVSWWDDGKEKPPINLASAYMCDVLAAGYKARTLPMAVGDTFSIPTHDVNKTYNLLVIVHSHETVETRAGKFDCFRVEPVMHSGGLFKKEKGARVFVWVTTDERRIPVKMQSKVSFGSVTAEMEQYTPGHAPE